MDYLQPAKPKNYLVEAILVTIFCCLPFGIVAIVYALQVDNYYAAGQYAQADRASRDAAKWAKVSLFASVAVIALYLLFIGIIIFLGLSFS